VGGQNLTITMGHGKLMAKLTELHDIWFHTIARAMAI
jgi:hypothetical protein